MFDTDQDTEPGIVFMNTSNKTEIIKWYTIAGAPAMKHNVHEDQMLVPMTARFTFVDGDPSHLFLNGRLVLKDGSTSDKVIQFANINLWSQMDWPEWLHVLYKQACSDFAADQQHPKF